MNISPHLSIWRRSRCSTSGRSAISQIGPDAHPENTSQTLPLDRWERKFVRRVDFTESRSSYTQSEGLIYRRDCPGLRSKPATRRRHDDAIHDH